MFYQIIGNQEVAHTYIICRFGRCFIIDPASRYDQIVEKIGDFTIEGILLTHAHHDHVHLIASFHVPIYIHEQDAALLFEDKYNGYGEVKRPYKRRELELKIIRDSDKIMLGDEPIFVYHTPGHTMGSVSYHYHQYVFTGDTLFKNDVGRHDLYSGNLSMLKRSVLRILELPGNIKICPGHDEMSTVREEKKYNPFYLKWLKQKKR